MIGPHRIREKLAAGGHVVGPIVNFDSPWFVDICGLVGFDFVVLDCEHGPISVERLEVMVRAAEAGGLSPLVRVPTNQPHEILRVLDIGAVGVQVPHIDSPDQARAAAAAIRYHPRGERGLAMGIRAAGYGVDIGPKAYTELANRELMFLCMVETAEAVQQVDAIAATEGVDMIVIGPSDLSQSMGHGGDRTVPAVQQAIDHVIARARAHGKAVSLPAADAAGARQCIERGANVIMIGPAAWLVPTGRRFLADLA
jgi:4-hydroxy-2-oxoheptanedioate aldolase